MDAYAEGERRSKRRSAGKRNADNIENFGSDDGNHDEQDVKKLSKLVKEMGSNDADSKIALKIALSLCKKFPKRLGPLDQPSSQDNKPRQVPRLGKLYTQYKNNLFLRLRSAKPAVQIQFLRIAMTNLHLQCAASETNEWPSSDLKMLLETLIAAQNGEEVREIFVTEYVLVYRDLYYQTLMLLQDLMKQSTTSEELDNMGDILFGIQPPLKSAAEPLPIFIDNLPSTKAASMTSKSILKAGERTFLVLLQSHTLSHDLRKELLKQSTSTILPWLSRPETLMDFFTDSYNFGGSTSLLALSGLFELMTKKNLDYPSFFPKLYSLLDGDLLHSKHRSRFLRLLKNFLSSSHLPATLVASFIKCLSRLCLYAPPAAIVAIIPLIYNLLKAHPAITFMIHRTQQLPAEDLISGDVFSMSESDSQQTRAIDSSLWEIETLQSHAHPNVASVARIISEQFTKQRYNLEDFLDHSYASMLESELRKDVKKPPVVEWVIPKRVFGKAAKGETTSSALLNDFWRFT